MLKKIMIVAGCLMLAVWGFTAWSAYSAKQRFDGVMAEYHKTPALPQAPTTTATRN
jgi:hypothetical protein